MVRNVITLAAFLLGGALCNTAVSAEGTYICKGEMAQRCRGMAPGVVWFDCNGNENTMANGICQEANGTGVRSLVHITGTGGNKCGYQLWKVFCQ
jgi:hypothetical protein